MADKRLSMDMKLQTLLQKKMKTWSSEEVLQYFIGTVLLSTGIILLALNVWTFITKMGFHSNFMDIRMDTTFFTLPTMTFCVPVFFMTACLSFNRRRLFYMILGLEIVAISGHVVGYAMGTKYQPKFTKIDLWLGSTIPKQYINNTLYTYVTYYESNTEFKASMDRIQHVLECCGVTGDTDYSTIPTSCCPKFDCQTSQPYQDGCIRPVQENIAWHRNITVSLCQVGVLLYLFHIVMITSVYVSYYYKWKTTTEDNTATRKKYIQ